MYSPSVASWFETREAALLTMRVWHLILRRRFLSAVSKDETTALSRPSPSRAKALAVDAGGCEHFGHGLRIGRLMRLVKTLEHQFGRGARHGKTLRHRRALWQHAGKRRLRPTMFGSIAMALTSAPHGRLWLDEAALRRSLGG